MPDQLQTFYQLIDKDDSYLDNLLFGNGFSIYFGSRFTYNNLFDEAKRLLEVEDIALFNHLDTTNFEAVLRALNITLDTNNIFDIETSNIRESYDRIKAALIETVKSVHPQPYEISFQDENSLKNTFSLFRKKAFTTNYDLLAYWALNKVNRRPRTVSDGFGYDSDTDSIMYDAGTGVRESENPIRLYHLHGSLHLYMDEGEVIKITRDKNPIGTIDKPLLETITDSFDIGYLPLYISEGTYKQKLNRILNNKYLRYCYSALHEMSNGLTIFGQSLDVETDRHIIDAVKNSKIRKVAFGIYDVSNQTRIIRQISELFEETTIELQFYDSRGFFESLNSIKQDLFW